MIPNRYTEPTTDLKLLLEQLKLALPPQPPPESALAANRCINDISPHVVETF